MPLHRSKHESKQVWKGSSVVGSLCANLRRKLGPAEGFLQSLPCAACFIGVANRGVVQRIFATLWYSVVAPLLARQCRPWVPDKPPLATPNKGNQRNEWCGMLRVLKIVSREILSMMLLKNTCRPCAPRQVHIVTKRRSSWACIGNPKPEQETSKGTHAQETSAYQRRPTTQHAAQGSNPTIRARSKYTISL